MTDVVPVFKRRINNIKSKMHKKSLAIARPPWELTGSNRRPSACKADALNQLS